MSIKEIAQELKELQLEIDKLERKEAEIINRFYNIYPILRDETKAVWTCYYGKEYAITNIHFEEQIVYLETAPYDEDNEVITVNFELFEEIYNEYHEVFEV